MARLHRGARLLAWQQNIKALIAAKENAVPGASEDSAIERPAGAGIGDSAETGEVDDTAPDDNTAHIDQVDDTARVDDTAQDDNTAAYDDTVQDDDTDGDISPYDDTAQVNDTGQNGKVDETAKGDDTAQIAQVDTAQTAQVDDTAQVANPYTQKTKKKKGKEKAVLLATLQRSEGSMPRVHQQLKQRRKCFAARDVAVVQKGDNGEGKNKISENSLDYVLASRQIPSSTT